MREDLLHCLWKHKKFDFTSLCTTEGEPLSLIDTGSHNLHAGPDFFNSRVSIGEQQWAGNVEIHINSSDWYVHGHEKDPNYDNVVLHVVWNHDAEVFRKDNSPIPVLELKKIIPEETLENYRQLLEASSTKWINCENDFSSFDDFELNSWLERLYFERLEGRSVVISGMLAASAGDWEEVLFRLLARNFGLNINGEAFLAMADSIPFSVVRKVRKDGKKLEALFLGQAGLLEKRIENNYYQQLQEEYIFLRTKFKLRPSLIPARYFRLRPDNFPNLRLAQLAGLYHHFPALFSEIIGSGGIEDMRKIFDGSLTGFWETHFTFEKPHSKRKKRLSPRFVELLLINTIVPLRFCFARAQGKEGDETLMEMITALAGESNKVVEKFNLLRPGTAQTALDSQALLELKKQYCDKNHCLQCRLGIKLLQREGQI